MAHRNTVFGQLLTLLPRHEFDAEARGHQRGPAFARHEPLGAVRRPRAGPVGQPAEPARHREQSARANPPSSITWALGRSAARRSRGSTPSSPTRSTKRCSAVC